MATIVLVHGATRGGWIWRRVAPLLAARGHEVYRPTLTGLGERVHLANRDTGLGTHVQDVLGVLEYEDLRDVVLVGHSYGGMVISGVAGTAAERLAHLVYLDAIVPRDGESLFAAIARVNPEAAAQRQQPGADDWLLPSIDPSLVGITDGADLAWLRARATPHPLKCFVEPVRVARPIPDAIPRTYIHCTEQTSISMDAFAAWLRTEPGWRLRELATGHEAPVSDPRGLAALLLEAAAVGRAVG